MADRPVLPRRRSPGTPLLHLPKRTIPMPRTPSVFQLDPFDQQKLDLLHAAATELWIGLESDDPLVQVAFHAVLEWLRGEVSTPGAVLATFSRPQGLLVLQLGFVGSLLHDP